LARRLPFDKLKDKIIDMKQRYGRAQLVIEESPISHGLIQSLSEKHINVVAIKPDRDKRSRLISQIDLFEGGSTSRTYIGSSPMQLGQIIAADSTSWC